MGTRKRRRPSIDSLYAGGVTGFANVLYLGFLIVLGALPLVTAHAAVFAGIKIASLEAQGKVHLSAKTFFQEYWRVLKSDSRGVVVSVFLLVIGTASLVLLLYPTAPAHMGWMLGSSWTVLVSIYAVGLTSGTVGDRPWQLYQQAIESVQRSPKLVLWSVIATALTAIFVLWVPPLCVVVMGPWAVAQLGIWAKFSKHADQSAAVLSRQQA